jgi:hypothetical protein
MKKFILYCILASGLYAQSDSLPQKQWLPSGVAGLNLNQVALSNWTQGGENAISFTLLGNFGLNYFSDPWQFKNSLKVAYGRTKLGSDDFRTNDNELYLENFLSRSVGWTVDPFISNTIRTVVGNGYKYDDSTFQTAAFFDPAYITQSLGFTYNKLKNFSTRLGIAFQETVTDQFRYYSDDMETPDEIESFKFDTGIESVTEIEQVVMENMLLKSILRLFSRFDSFDVWDVRWDNIITAKVNEYVNVNFNVLVIHEISQTRKTQMKEALQLGLTFALF